MVAVGDRLNFANGGMGGVIVSEITKEGNYIAKGVSTGKVYFIDSEGKLLFSENANCMAKSFIMPPKFTIKVVYKDTFVSKVFGSPVDVTRAFLEREAVGIFVKERDEAAKFYTINDIKTTAYWSQIGLQ